MQKMLDSLFQDKMDSVVEKIIRTVIQYSNSQNIDALYTWGGVNISTLMIGNSVIFFVG